MVVTASKKIIDNIIDTHFLDLIKWSVPNEYVIYIASIPENLDNPNLDCFYLEMGIWNKVKKTTRTRPIDISLFDIKSRDVIKECFSPPKINQELFDKIEKGEVKMEYSINYVQPFDLQIDRVTENKIRPAASGCQISADLKRVKKGTFGGLLRLEKYFNRQLIEEDKGQEWYIITNSHVVNNIVNNTLIFSEENIYQPGKYRKFKTPFIDQNQVLNYGHYIKADYDNILGKVCFGQYNDFVDVAFIKVRDKEKVEGGNIWNDRKILNPEVVTQELQEVTKIIHGEEVTLFGKSSYESNGRVRSTNAYVVFNPDKPNPKIFKKQILTEKISASGDSGSLIINKDNQAIGLLIGGDSFSYSVCNNFDYIFGDNTFYKPNENSLQLKLKEFINLNSIKNG